MLRQDIKRVCTCEGLVGEVAGCVENSCGGEEGTDDVTENGDREFVIVEIRFEEEPDFGSLRIRGVGGEGFAVGVEECVHPCDVEIETRLEDEFFVEAGVAKVVQHVSDQEIGGDFGGDFGAAKLEELGANLCWCDHCVEGFEDFVVTDLFVVCV